MTVTRAVNFATHYRAKNEKKRKDCVISIAKMAIIENSLLREKRKRKKIKKNIGSYLCDSM